MTSPIVLDVGQCGFDHSSIKSVLVGLGANVVQAHSSQEALTYLAETPVSLVLVNRIFDRDGAKGLELIKTMKKDPTTSTIPVMLISNYEDAQTSAIALGAIPGFGKSALNTPMTTELLKQQLTSL